MSVCLCASECVWICMCTLVDMHVQSPQDRLQPIGSSCQHPFGTDVNRKTYGCFGRDPYRQVVLTSGILQENHCLGAKVIFWLSL